MDDHKVDIRLVIGALSFTAEILWKMLPAVVVNHARQIFVEGFAWSVDHVSHDITNKANLSKFSSRIFWRSKTSDRMIDLSLNFETGIPTGASFNFITSKRRHLKTRVIRSRV